MERASTLRLSRQSRFRLSLTRLVACRVPLKVGPVFTSHTGLREDRREDTRISQSSSAGSRLWVVDWYPDARDPASTPYHCRRFPQRTIEFGAFPRAARNRFAINHLRTTNSDRVQQGFDSGSVPGGLRDRFGLISYNQKTFGRKPNRSGCSFRQDQVLLR